MASERAPDVVQQWIARPPGWMEIRDAQISLPDDPSLLRIDAGEVAAMRLAALMHADLLLMDDRKGVRLARGKGLRVTGTLGILEVATHAGLIDLAAAAGRLRRTNFRSPKGLLGAMVKKHGGHGGKT